MKKIIYHQLTPMHVGSGSSLGVVDLPIYREAHTDFPAIPSSAIKGVVRANYEKEGKDNVEILFGNEDMEGDIIFTDAKILLFPVKSLKGVFVWITSPLALQRFERDTNTSLNLNYSNLTGNKAFVSSDSIVLKNNNKNIIVLEEFSFEVEVNPDIAKLKDVSSDKIDKGKIVILPDDVFRFFVKNYTEVVARIRIDQETGTVKEGGLWYQELTPTETVYYGCVTSRTNNQENLKKIVDFINGKILQFGGDETLGRGFTHLKVEGN
ncbi:MAG: type III-B CRISPR module RAMP protein Cmr4 [Sulfurihydrogenibium sp.]